MESNPYQSPEHQDPVAAEDPPAPQQSIPLTRENLAEVLLRFFGVYLVAYGLINAIVVVSSLVSTNRFDLEEPLAPRHLFYFVHPAVELVLGLYFLMGGQWVFEKVLMPVVRSAASSLPNMDEDQPRTAGAGQPQNPSATDS
jgi:hypothetical protein